tara:strand:- start:1234 stop:1833 length:600 start_codon:yes stop_codon:yes gene_type:complete
MVSKALYIGAGIDTRPFQLCDWATKFYCVDSQPYSEFGTLLSGNIYKDGYDGYARPNFIKELEEEYIKKDFVLTGCNINEQRFYTNKKNQIVCYYVNTAIPDHHFRLRDVCKEIDTLIVAGHEPDSIFLNYVKNRLDFIGFEGTYYGNQEIDNHNGIIARLHRNEVNHYFKSYIYFHNNGKKLTFSLWEDFMDYYYTLN